MAEETQPKPSEPSDTVAETAETETKIETQTKPKEDEEVAKDPTDESAPGEDAAAEAVSEEIGVTQSASFKEESNIVADLDDPEKKALDELKQLIQTAMENKEFSPPPPPPPPAKKEEKTAVPKVDEEAKAEEVKTVEAMTEEEVKTEEAANIEVVKAEEKVEGTKAEIETKEVKIEEKVEVKTEEGAKEDEKVVIIEETTEVTPIEEKTETQQEVQEEEEGEFSIWGVPVLGDEKSDTLLLKFLRARDFKVKDAMTMIKNSIIWRKQFGIEALVNENLEVPELEKAVFYHGVDKEGHPVCYNVYGEFQDKDLYAKAFGEEEKREKFLRWRIQYLEKGIREKLDFIPGGVCTMVQVTDLKSTPGPGKKELRVATKKALTLLQDNYPEFVAKQVFINVPWWYLAYNRVISPFLTQRSKSKFVFAGPSNSAETLFKYIAPEQVPVQYGGLSKDSDTDFTTADAVTDVTIKPTGKHTIEIPASEGSVLVWELRVIGWEVSYGAEFVPATEDGYTVIVQKARKFLPTDEPYVKNSFKIGEPGKVILTIDNATSKKKKLLYRYKEKSTTECI